MDLALNFLLVLLLEIPLVGFFFRRKTRKKAYMAAFLINIVTWPLVQILFLNTNFYYKGKFLNPIVDILVFAIELLFYGFYLKISLRKAILVALAANLLSNTANYFIKIPPDFFQKKSNQIIR